MPEVTPGPNGSRASVISELRIGLAMSGAIALVLYEAGVTHEVFRLMQGWRDFQAGGAPPPDPLRSGPEGYLACFQHIPIRPVVDILTGASAGGVNSTLLASCLASGEDFTKYHDILLNNLGVEALSYSPKDAPVSLMDSRILYGVLTTELGKNAAIAQGRISEDTPDLRVRLCRTHLAGHCEITRDAIGHEIDVETRSDVIEFSTEDFTRADRVEAVAKAALATSAFPGAFGPVEDDGIWYVDGGLWDNQPIDWAVQAVTDKPAFLRTHRCILFVEPNPPERPPDIPSNQPEKQPSLAEILMAIPFMGVKGNVWPTIRNLLDYNRRGTVYSGIVKNPELQRTATELGAQAREEADRQLAQCADFASHLRSGTWRVEPPQPLSNLNRVRFDDLMLDGDAAIAQRWRAISEAWNALQMRLPAAASALWFATTPADASSTFATPADNAAVAALNAAGTFDLERRAIRRRIEEINAELKEAQPEDRLHVTRDTSPLKAALYTRLEQLNQYLYDDGDASPRDASAYHSRLVRYHSRFRLASLTVLHDLEGAFRQLLFVPAKATSDDEAAFAVAALLSRPQTNPILILADWVETVRRLADAAKAGSGVEVGLQYNDLSADSRWRTPRLFAQHFVDHSPDPLLAEVASVHVTDLDVARHILAAMSDLEGRSPMDLVRVSPNDTNNLYLVPRGPDDSGTGATRKLAGEGLGHLQGFLETRWRRNDYIWGRLDACEILLRTMRLYGERQGYRWSEPDYEDALCEAQNAILKQEASLYQAWLARHHKPAAPRLAEVEAIARSDARSEQSGSLPLAAAAEMATKRKANALLIGFGAETFLDADEPAFTNNVNYLLQTTVRMLQGSASKPPYMLGRLERIVRILSYVIRWVAALAPPFREAPKAGSVWKWSAFVFAAMGLAGIAGWSIGGKHDLLNALVVVSYGVLAFVAILAVGCVVGYRAGYATVVGTVAGACLGAGAVVWNSPALRVGTVSVAGLDISWLVAIPVAGFCALVISYAIARLMSRIPRMG